MKLSDQAGLLLSSKALTAILFFIQGPILARILSVPDYGTFLQVNIITSVMVSTAAWGLPQGIFYFVPRLSPEKRGGFILRTINTVLVLYVIGGVLFYVGSDQIGTWMNNPILSELAILVVFLSAVMGISDNIESVLLVSRQTLLLGVCLPTRAVLRMSAAIIPPLFGMGLKGILWGLIVVMVGESLFLYGYVLRSADVSEAVFGNLKEIVARFHYSSPIALSTISLSLGATADKFIVSGFIPVQEFAIYARCAFEFPLIGMISSVLTDLLLTRFVELWVSQDKKEIARLMREGIRRMACIFYPTFVLCWILAPEIIAILFTESYSGGTNYFRIFLLILLFQVGPCYAALRATGDTKLVFGATLVKVGGVVLFSLAAVMSVGLSGVALGVVTAHVLAVVYLVVVTSRRLGVTPSAIIPGKELVKILAMSVVIAITVFPLTWWIESKIITVFIVGLAYVVLLAPSAMVFKVVSDGDLAVLQRWFSFIRMRLPLLRASG